MGDTAVGASSVGIPPPAVASGAATSGGGVVTLDEIMSSTEEYAVGEPLKVPEVSSEPSVDQKLFLVVSVALATVCFFTNIVQVNFL